ncbi:MAG: hypothetical protein AAFX78_02075 [Cyanobacteria bacterium J06638_20]
MQVVSLIFCDGTQLWELWGDRPLTQEAPRQSCQGLSRAVVWALSLGNTAGVYQGLPIMVKAAQ